MDSSDSTVDNTNSNRRSKPGTFHETFCKTRIDPKGSTRITPKTNWQTGTGIGIAKENSEHQVRGTFTNRGSFNQGGFRGGNLP